MATITFTGDPRSAFIHGIPARDLSDEDYAALDNERRKAVRDSPLYEYAAYRDANKAAQDAAKAEPETPPEPSEPAPTEPEQPAEGAPSA